MKETITKKELIKAVSQKFEMRYENVSNVLGGLLDEIKKILENEKRIELRGFGVFFSHIRKGRRITVPRTGDVMESSDRLMLKFKPSKKLIYEIKRKAEQ